MRLTFDRDKLLNALSVVSRAIPSKTTNSILECALFDVTDESIVLSANDNELGIETKVEGKAQGSGKAAINLKLILDIVKKLDFPGEKINIEVNEENFMTVISSGKSIFKIQARNGEEFNYLPEININNSVTVSQFILKEAIRQTVFAANINDTNKMTGGELVELHENTLKFVALDGVRVAIRNIRLNEEFPDDKFIIPARNLNEIGRSIEGNTEKEITVYFSDNHVLFRYDSTSIISRIIAGDYFDLKYMLTSDYETKIRVSRLSLLNSIDRALVFVRENNHKPLIFDISDGMLKLKMESPYGSMNDEIECEKSGNNIMIAFNPKYFIDALRVVDDEIVDIYMTNSRSPCFIRDIQQSYIYIVLPVNFIA